MQQHPTDLAPGGGEVPGDLPGAVTPCAERDGGGHVTTHPRTLRSAISQATDGQLALLVSLPLFVLAAWPLALVDLPPLQDLPNHLAATTVIEHPALYPEFVFNGFVKTNAALFTWLLLVGRVVGLKAAARLFVLGVLALGAIAWPRFVLAFGGRRRMVVSAFFAWPMVHNWFVSSGMLDFAIAVPLATLLLVMLRENVARRNTLASAVRAAGAAALSLLVWYAHVFPLLVVYLLVALRVVRPGPGRRTGRERRIEGLLLAAPLVPSSVLVAGSLWVHMTEPAGPMTGEVHLGKFLPPWELFYNLWAEWFYAFTWLEVATLVPCVTLGLWALYNWRAGPPLLGPAPFAVLGLLYFFTPYVATNWFHVNSRFIPFLWLAALVRLPERLPRSVLVSLGVCAIASSVGMGVDYVRLRRDWERFGAGMGAVPEGARLLPLVFRAKGASENTRNLLHAWGFYVTEKRTSAPLLFAHSRSFAVTYREPPPPQFNHLVLESFAPTMDSPDPLCILTRTSGVAVEDCGRAWRSTWQAFWHMAAPEFDRVLLWAAPAPVLALVPPDYRIIFRRDELTILARRDPPDPVP